MGLSFKEVQTKMKGATKWDYQGTLRKVKDTSNFEIDKAGRFSARFFQIALALISYYWIAQMANETDFLSTVNIGATNGAML